MRLRRLSSQPSGKCRFNHSLIPAHQHASSSNTDTPVFISYCGNTLPHIQQLKTTVIVSQPEVSSPRQLLWSCNQSDALGRTLFLAFSTFAGSHGRSGSRRAALGTLGLRPHSTSKGPCDYPGQPGSSGIILPWDQLTCLPPVTCCNSLVLQTSSEKHGGHSSCLSQHQVLWGHKGPKSPLLLLGQ